MWVGAFDVVKWDGEAYVWDNEKLGEIGTQINIEEANTVAMKD